MPEFARYGYLSCTSCHVASAGGGLITPYGRGFAQEKLSTWAYPNEAQLLHGAFGETGSTFLLSGHFRGMQTYSSNAVVHQGRYMPMQRSLEAGFVLGSFSLVADVHYNDRGTSSAYNKAAIDTKTHYAQFTILDEFRIRGGRFFPRYGLMIPQHNASIRGGLGMNQGDELYQVEAGYYGEFNELTVAGIFSQGDRHLSGEKPTNFRDMKSGKGAVIYYHRVLAEKHRVGVNYLTQDIDKTKKVMGGVHATLALPSQFGLMLEADRAFIEIDKVLQKKHAFYAKLNHESYKGVFPALVYDVMQVDLKGEISRSDTTGLMLNWYPRPHFEIELMAGSVIQRPSFMASDTGYLMLHYYL